MSLFSLPDKKNHSSFTSSTSQQTYYFKDWQYSILFDSFCMNWDLEQKERYMCFCIKKYLYTDVYHQWIGAKLFCTEKGELKISPKVRMTCNNV